MVYKVTKQYSRGNESDAESFKDLQAARAFVEEKRQEDAGMNVKVTYRIYDDFDLIETLDPNDQQTGDSTSQGSSGQGAGSRFSPNPFSTTPRPPGSPQGWVKDDEEEKNNQ